ncbi:MAG: dipeptidase [Pseudomonadota bacterium]
MRLALLPAALLLAALLLAACGSGEAPAKPENPAGLAERAERIAAESIIVDGHIDVPYRVNNKPADVSQATDDGDFDYPRAVAGHLNAPFMSIYTPAELEAEGRSREVAEELIDMVEAIVADAPDKFAVATSVSDVRRHFEEGLISLPLGMENGSPIEGSLDTLQHFYDRGIRYVTLAHSLSNHVSDSSYDENRVWNGLSDFGKSLIPELNRLGIMIDISHVSDDAFWQVMELSAVPAIASHSSARHFTPGFERNMSDEMIVRLAEEGGIIMINYGSSFITAEARAYSDIRRDARDAARAAKPELDAEALKAEYLPAFEAEHGPYPYATLDDVLDHIDHVVALAGIESVGIGSDYDGVGDSLPIGLKDVASYPALVEGLLERGYSEADIKLILGENLLRVWSAVEAYAATKKR